MKVLSAVFAGLQKLATEQLGEAVTPVGESFNLHYRTARSFIKVTRPWVSADRLATEVKAARHVASLGIPVALPLVDEPLSFTDNDDVLRWATFWRYLPAGPPLPASEATALGAAWIRRLWELPAFPQATEFRLDGFLSAVQLRLAYHESELAPRILSAVGEVVAKAESFASAPLGFIHGDLHNDNLLPLPTGGAAVVDWESSCIGPMEWDVAQNMRYATVEDRPAREAYWARAGANMDLVQLYRRVRSLSSLSHMVASDVKPPMYYRALTDLGWA